jgi:hypothetical protein
VIWVQEDEYHLLRKTIHSRAVLSGQEGRETGMKIIDTFVPAMIVGEVDGVILFVNRVGQFFKQWHVEDGDYQRIDEVSREDALAWCREKGLPECDYGPLFGLWD